MPFKASGFQPVLTTCLPLAHLLGTTKVPGVYYCYYGHYFYCLDLVLDILNDTVQDLCSAAYV